MSVWHVCGGNELTGSVSIPGSPMAAVFYLAASLMAGCETELTNCPDVREVREVLSFLQRSGCEVRRTEDVVYADVSHFHALDASAEGLPYPELFRTAFAVRQGEPRGGGVISLESGDPVTTACAMLAACGAGERTLLLRASKEPEIAEFQQFLRLLGANITGAGSDLVIVDGFSPLKRIGYRVCPDRFCGAAVLCACAGAGGSVELKGIRPESLHPVTDILTRMGCNTEGNGYILRFGGHGNLRGGGTVIAGGYPKLSPEFIPLLMAAGLKSTGRTVLVNRGGCFPGTDAMMRLGGNIGVMGSVAVVNGTKRLCGASLRSESEPETISLIAAALGAEGTSDIVNACPETGVLSGVCGVLRQLGAVIKKSD